MIWPFKRRKAQPLPMPRDFVVIQPRPDAVDVAADFLRDVPASRVGIVVYDRLLHPSPKGGALSSEQLYEISNRVGRLAHAKARQEAEADGQMAQAPARPAPRVNFGPGVRDAH